MRSAFLILALSLTACQHLPSKDKQTNDSLTLKVATFNVSMEADNYKSVALQGSPQDALKQALESGVHPQIRNIAEIIQRTQPDIILLNEFDYIEDATQGIELFKQKYLQVSQSGQLPVEYPYVFLAPVNTGVAVSEEVKSKRFTHFAYGRYPGQYGMVLLSKYPILADDIRTFRHFLWKDMPNHLMPTDETGSPWYSAEATEVMRLSSKSHWDVPIEVCGNQINVLASHPTPPVFDGPEDRNGKRNHDELRFWRDYIEADPTSYHYDDGGRSGGIKPNAQFVIVGDLNASAVEGDAYPGAMSNLLEHKRVGNFSAPESEGGKENKPDSKYAATHTAGWGMRADYVLASSNLKVADSGVFWPEKTQATSRLVKDRAASSDHRLVWANIKLQNKSAICSSENN